MATLELYKKYNMEPVKHYEPDAVMDVYYSKLAGGSAITRCRSESSVIQDIRRLRTTPEPETEPEPIVASAPPVVIEEEEEGIDDSLRTYHLRETGCFYTTRLPSYNESLS